MAKQNPATLVSLAEKYIGLPYKWGGTSPTTGFDCSGFVQWLYAQQGITIPRVTYDQVNAGNPVDKSDLRAGDIVFFEPSKQGPGHEGLYIGDGKFIESPHTGADIRVSELADRTDYVTARRIIPDGAPHIGNVAQATPAVTQDVPPAATGPSYPSLTMTPPTTDTATAAPSSSLLPVDTTTQTAPLTPTAPVLPTATGPAPGVLTPPGGGPALPGGGPQLPGMNPWQQLGAMSNLSPDTQNLLSIGGGSV